MKTFIALALVGAASAQVRYEDIRNGPGADWLTYAGSYDGQRHSPLTQITPANAPNLTAKWVFHVPQTRRLESVPLVRDGVLYFTNSNEIFALDGRSGRQIWTYRDDSVKAQRVNRGAALLGDKVYFVTSDCHLVALNAKSGALAWSSQYADPKKGYFCPAAPLAAKDKLIVGVGGGDSGMRGFLAAMNAETGAEAWRLYTVPARGEPGSESWGDLTLDWGGAGTWLSGTFDPELNLLYWTTGNPWPDFYAGHRAGGDNLYSDSLIAVDLDTGKMKWYFQFTPRDVWDWDAQSWPILIDLPWEGSATPRKLVFHANRNGFFYVLDRTTGKFLRATRLAELITWAKGIDPETGRPDMAPDMAPSAGGTEVCPSVRGVTNWMSQTYDAKLGLYFLPALEQCDIYTSSAKTPEPMKGFAGTGGEQIPSRPGKFYMRAFSAATGNKAWEYPMTGKGAMWAGTVSTASGVLFFGDDDGQLVALESKTGKHLWHFNTGQGLTASPITYEIAGKQYVAIATQTDVMAFGLFEPVRHVPLVKETVE
ncbi:MAG: PQQ-binding-like beta-propeller repeat protein [Bryobacteraceae bacterium]